MIFLLLTLLTFAGPGFGQVTVYDVNGSAVPEPVAPVKAEPEDDAGVGELERQRRIQIENALKMDESRKQLIEQTTETVEGIEEASVNTIRDIGKLDDKAIDTILKNIKMADLSSRSAPLVRKQLFEQSQGKPLGRIFAQFPVTLDVMVDLIRDKQALPGLVGMLKRKNDLKNYGFFVLFVAIMSFLIRRFVFPKHWSGGTRFMMGLLLSLAGMTLTFGVFYISFKTEVAPAVAIVLKRIT
jgi:hypothetical protein